MRLIFFCSLFLYLSVGWTFSSHALNMESRQVTDSVSAPDSCFQKDIFDVLFPQKKISTRIPSRKVRAIMIPIIGYSPGTGFQVGAGASLSWPMGKNPATNLSAGSVQLTWTTERQLIFQVRSNMFLSRNKWFIKSDWRWYIFNNPTYGLGTGPSANIPEIPGLVIYQPAESVYAGGSFPMKYNWIKFHNILFREIARYYYFGLGYHFDDYYDIRDENLILGEYQTRITPHYSYSVNHGYNPTQYTSSGLSLNFAYDSRDNIINAYEGVYVNVQYLANFTEIGSTNDGTRLWTEFRTYIGLSEKMPRHLLALWFFGSFKLSGSTPYLNLMSNGFDQMNSSGRGYAQGRWRGDDFIYGEAEYRFPISRCSRIFGGVLFANVTTASNRDMKVPLFGYLKVGCGFGFRIMVGKNDRTNILIDFGLGQQSLGMYLQAQEIF